MRGLSIYNQPIDFFDLILDSFFDNWHDPGFYVPGVNYPKLVTNNEKDYTITVDVPGFDENEVQVEVNSGVLSISAEHKEGDTIHRKFGKSWTLPKNVNEEEISGSLKNGVLTVVVPKKEPPKARKIELTK